MDIFPSSDEGRQAPTSLGPLDKVNKWIKLALSKEPSRVGVSLSSPDDGNRSSFRNLVFSSYLEFRTIDKVHNPSYSECYTTSSETYWSCSVTRFRDHAWVLNPKFHHRVHKIEPFIPILSQDKSVHSVKLCCFNLHFIFCTHLRSSLLLSHLPKKSSMFLIRATFSVYLIFLYFLTLLIFVKSKSWTLPGHSSGGYSLASYRGGPGSNPDQIMWDLWWTEWHWVRFLQVLRLPLPIIPPIAPNPSLSISRG
jgi:hypothetical protein